MKKNTVGLSRFCFVVPDRKGYLGWSSAGTLETLPFGVKHLGLYKGISDFFLLIDVTEGHTLGAVFSKTNNTLPKTPMMTWMGEVIGSKSAVRLKRYFKKPPRANGLANAVDGYRRTVMNLELQNDVNVLKEYKNVHAPGKVWPQIIKNMDAIGVLDMEIYLYGYQAFLIMDTLPNFDMDREGKLWAEMPMEKEWQAHVAKFQKTDSESSAVEKWKPLVEIKVL